MGTLEELRENRDREATEGLESKMAKPAGFVRKEAQVQWLISKIINSRRSLPVKDIKVKMQGS